jgi:hypothetical protein
MSRLEVRLLVHLLFLIVKMRGVNLLPLHQMVYLLETMSHYHPAPVQFA